MELKELGVLSNLLTPTGQLIDNEGQVALLTLSGKGGWFTLDAGKLFPLANTNPNSGVLVMLGVGSVHHRVHFENTENRITQLEEPYVSGYDRLTWGAGCSGICRLLAHVGQRLGQLVWRCGTLASPHMAATPDEF